MTRLLKALSMPLQQRYDFLMGGVFSAGEDRLGSIIRTQLPYVGLVVLWIWSTLVQKKKFLKSIKKKASRPQCKCDAYAHFRSRKQKYRGVDSNELNQMQGEVRFLLPLKGVSLLDAEGQTFHNPKQMLLCLCFRKRSSNRKAKTDQN